MDPRVTSSSDGRGAALTALVAEWAAREPKIRRVWTCEGHRGALAVALELRPVGDSEETAALWLAHCEKWRRDLARRLRRSVELEWLDPDEHAAPNQPRPGEMRALIYERAS